MRNRHRGSIDIPVANKRLYFTPSRKLRAYLRQIRKLGIYGDTNGSVVNWIVGKEVMRLLEKGVLIKVEVLPDDEEGEDDEQE